MEAVRKFENMQLEFPEMNRFSEDKGNLLRSISQPNGQIIPRIKLMQ